MFRKGGLSQETGILSGLDSPRRGYAQGSYVPRVGYATGPKLPVESAIDKWKRVFKGGSSGQGIFDEIKRKLASTTGTTGTTQNIAKPGRIRQGVKTGLDFFKKGAGMARTGIGSMLSYAPAGPATYGSGAIPAGGAIAGPALGIGAAIASPFIAQAAATGQRKKGMSMLRIRLK